MNGIIKITVLIVLALAIASGPAMAQQTMAGAGATAGTGERKTFTLDGSGYTINPIDKVNAERLQEMGVQTVSVPAGSNVLVTYSTDKNATTSTGPGPANVVVFGPGGFAGAAAKAGAGSTGAGAGAVVGPGGAMQTYSFTGKAGEYYVITQRTDGIRDMVLVSFD
ncbi:MAG: hypothetical protein A4E28_00199 [Methanocella sp. PtaU1.Bin125]|nr:MAG: hypothetical protein A4E28_00199 [Methanocella sp. PtaU1.Bin125]